MLYIVFSAQIDKETSQTLMKFLSEQINQGEEEFYFLFSTSGGMVIDGVALYNFIRSLSVKITMHNIGIVDSIGNVVFLAADERYANPQSSFLFHGVGFNVPEKTRLEEKNLTERLTGITRDQKIIKDIIRDRTKLGEAEIDDMFLNAKTKTPDEAKQAEIIKEVKKATIPKGSRVVSFKFEPQKKG